tara:strand:+ start:262 stop:435 length:174 start_codon:yes stop_codon:yes gene_type:complete
MKAPSAPKKLTWILGLAAGLLGIIGHYFHADILTQYNYELLLGGFIILAIGATFRDI